MALRVRRFWCLNEACQRKIFGERLPHSVAAYARRWKRRSSPLLQVAFVLGGRPGERLSHQLAMPVSNDTLLRALRKVSVPDLPHPRVLGGDDWAFRKAKTYGRIMVDLENKMVLDSCPECYHLVVLLTSSSVDRQTTGKAPGVFVC